MASTDDLKAFHAMDIKLYRRLVIDNGRDLIRCMHAIAFWLFLEEVGYPNLVEKLLVLMNDAMLNCVLDEAIHCLSLLGSVTPPPIQVVGVSDMPLTQQLMGNGKAISVWMLYQQRSNALARVKQTVEEAFARAFADTVEEAVDKICADNITKVENQNQQK